MTLSILVIAICVTLLVSFLCSLSEAVLYSLPITFIESMIQKGKRAGFVGVVTLEDVLEEIIGREIVGEFDPAVDMRELARRKRWEGPVKPFEVNNVAEPPVNSL